MNKYFPLLVNLLSHDDSRYKKWRRSLKRRPAPWNKGYTKENNSSVLKISRTFKNKKLDNFKKWRDRMKKVGKIKSVYPVFNKDGNLAELIGVILGDGYIGKFPRTEVLTILSNSNNIGFIKRYSGIVKKIFDKNPSIFKRRKSNCVEIKIYQKEISKRLFIPSGSRKNLKIKIPYWISQNRNYLKRYLRGLYEAEGSFCVHKPTYAYKFLFSNRNNSLLEIVFSALRFLGFHPHRSKYSIQVSKKKEVYKLKELLKFREY